MKEQLISFETAKLAREKGFEEHCDYLYWIQGDDGKTPRLLGNYNNVENNDISSRLSYSAPTQSLLQKWLRDNHNIYITPNVVLYYNSESEKNEFNGWNCNIEDLNLYENVSNPTLNTYEEAFEVGLQEGLNLI